ncbi:MAG: PQQ-binding-like beta-propeller repeat protein [Nanoarchaeota archaeon]|nr:PQQ-binding-like beta-propeller repeat protein [Nanoarchaeota archaeon]
MKFTFGLKKIASGNKRGRILEQWKFDSHSSLLAPPIIASLTKNKSHSIITGTKDGKIISVDLDANIEWVFNAKEDIDKMELMFLDVETSSSIQASPNVCDINNDGEKEIVVGSELGNIYTLNSKGKLLWKFKTNGSIRGTPLIADINNDGKKEIIFGSGDKNLYALDNRGVPLWKYDAKTEIESCPQKVQNQIVFGCSNGEITSVNNKGELLWRFKTKAKVLAQPISGKIFGNEKEVIIIGSTDNYLYCLDLKGELIWSFKTRGAIYSKVVLADINNDGQLEIIFGSCDNNVYALDSNGEIIWSYETDFWIVAPPLVEDIDGDGQLEVIVGSYDQNIYILDARGSYKLNYVPGVSSVMQQAGHYTDIMTEEPGTITGKKIWQYKTEGIIVGCGYINETKSIIVNTKTGKINKLTHQD